jgi:hypothetical protein
MVNPSGIRLPDGENLKVEVVNPGIYSIENAYEGQFEYFDDRPIDVSTQISETAAPASVLSESAPASRK